MLNLSLFWFAYWLTDTNRAPTVKNDARTVPTPNLISSLSNTDRRPHRGRANDGRPLMTLSYSSRLPGSLSTSLPSAMILKFSSALRRVDFGRCESLSGWYCSASRRYLPRISVALAEDVTFRAP